MENEVKICCPKCDWEPDGGAYWACTCGHIWNTFETAARCPACGIQWSHTQCPGPHYPGGCGAHSPHLDWYRGLDRLVEREMLGIRYQESGVGGRAGGLGVSHCK